MTITDAKIERLMYRSGKAGDQLQVELCRTALGYRPDATAEEVDEARARCEVYLASLGSEAC